MEKNSYPIRQKFSTEKLITRIIIKKTLIGIAFFFVLIFFLVFGNADINKIAFSWAILVISTLLLVQSRKNVGLFIVYSLISYFNYSIVVTNYLDILSSSYFTSFSTDYVSYLGVLILYIFNIILYLTAPGNIKKQFSLDSIFLSNERNAFLITTFLVIILVYLLFFQFVRPETEGVRGAPSALYEYSIIIFIIGFYFVGKNKFARIILTLILFLMAAQNFIFGGRIIGVQLLTAYFIIFHSSRIKFYKMIPLIVVGFMAMSLIGMERASLTLSLDLFNEMINSISTKKLALDTSYSAYFTSMTFLKTQEFLSFTDRLVLFSKFLLSIIFGSRISNSSLPLYTLSYYQHYNGGVFPFYFYFYLGWFGVFLSALLVNIYTRIVNSNYKKYNGYIACITVYFVSTTFRWYLYTPLIILRGALLLTIVYYLILVISKINRR